MCDVSMETMEETARLANPGSGVRLTSHTCDVSVESDMIRFREEIEKEHKVQHMLHHWQQLTQIYLVRVYLILEEQILQGMIKYTDGRNSHL